ncbi:hypothetical protein CBW57_00170 [Yersinia intermedia]|uniref:Uncharacterized protein n=1 Tax=Yersinia intermedia TaxID=631 RepID=A0A209AD57_YERIN|nr:hypothetical protein CBW57_00170 [Yersinia intermedia]
MNGGSAHHPHVLRVRCGDCTLSMSKMPATITLKFERNNLKLLSISKWFGDKPNRAGCIPATNAFGTAIAA